MPIGSLTSFGGVASLATLRTNVNVIEEYIQGKITPLDFQDKLKLLHGRRGTAHRLYGTSWNSGADTRVPFGVDDPKDVWELDRDALMDFTAYGNPDAEFWNGTQQLYAMTSENLVSWFTWEKMGNVPTQFQNGQGAKLETTPQTWHNWLFNAPDPYTDVTGLPGTLTYRDGRLAAKRFPSDEYWDRWLTVPYATHRIWVPDRCVLHVVANAVGTWNHNFNPALERDTESVGTGGHAWENGYDQTTENPAHFRLFIDRDNDKEWRGFSWEVNEDTWYANWSPIQPHPQVGYGGPNETPNNGKMLGREWSFTCAPRGQAQVASQILVPEKGWYNISLKYNSRYWYGYTHEPAPGIYSWLDTFLPASGSTSYRPGPIFATRWESTGIGAVALFNRDAPANDSSSSQFT